jgi:prevent-host-death family protein
METFSVAEAKRRFSELIDRVAAGERFVVARRGKPVLALIAADDADPEEPGHPRGLLALIGALADVEGFDEEIQEIVRQRRFVKDRPPPDLT